MTPDEYMGYEQDVREAQIAFPGMEMRAAYVKFMKEVKKKEPKSGLSTNDPELDAAKAAIQKTVLKPCGNGCPGTMELSGVCPGCLAGQKGFKSQWQCRECLRVEYSKLTFFEIYNEMKVPSQT